MNKFFIKEIINKYIFKVKKPNNTFVQKQKTPTIFPFIVLCSVVLDNYFYNYE